MNSVLFVDDDASVLQGLRRMLRELRHEWISDFAPSGAAALDTLARGPFDVVVTDMRMPGMDGGELLTEVMNRHPDMVRIILSGQADEDSVIRTVGAAHQYLAKPCDAETLKKTVGRACALRTRLTDPTLKRLVSHMGSLPSLPESYARLVAACESPLGSLRAVSEIIAGDVGMTAKILHLVNSAFFGLRTRVSSPVEAAQILGLHTIRSLVRAGSVFSRLECDTEHFPVATFSGHSALTAACARRITELHGDDLHLANDASVAGMLHDAGQLVLASHFPERYGQTLALAAAERLPIEAAESRIFGTNHATVGAYLLGLWGLSDTVVDAVARHHEPSAADDRAFSPLTAVHVADAIADELAEHPDAWAALDREYLARLGLDGQIDTWRARCRTYAGDTRSHE